MENNLNKTAETKGINNSGVWTGHTFEEESINPLSEKHGYDFDIWDSLRKVEINLESTLTKSLRKVESTLTNRKKCGNVELW